MKKWEYRLIDSTEVQGEGIWGDMRDKHNLEAYLNRLGRQGWEIVNLDVLEQHERINFIGVARRPKGRDRITQR